LTDTSNRWLETRTVSGDAYDATYDRRAAAGENVHGEADFVEGFAPASVLDAGCGTGRVGRELAHRGLDVVGVDIDPEMLATARRKAPGVDWRLADLATVDLSRSFEAIVMAGNVMIFLEPGSEAAVVANMARHLGPGGLLIAGFQLMPDRLSLARYDQIAIDGGLVLAERWSTWDREAWQPDSDYAVSVHKKGPRLEACTAAAAATAAPAAAEAWIRDVPD
jgi:SAM-dependent methyltransferase